uniref:Uncharacterized protein n=1 Tax=Chromera velia CCMP2878 TaxID=1169474 RepID=A0A0G4H398_9ALVE|eukprot:Cvel_24527.t1-p1 / transcript=Cvel_24527.t1 / gene=Cvel_24527 / organism=Chromera_velia_CCMP2878 / gene_product=hypothetical protein / transcript_product=hypothetical protein / location=Cvel_scaffold2661:19851-25234(+) / protein_length=372 / sequence_SO=supercontig / SO=protein_coding / is_pseudo=false
MEASLGFGLGFGRGFARLFLGRALGGVFGPLGADEEAEGAEGAGTMGADEEAEEADSAGAFSGFYPSRGTTTPSTSGTHQHLLLIDKALQHIRKSSPHAPPPGQDEEVLEEGVQHPLVQDDLEKGIMESSETDPPMPHPPLPLGPEEAEPPSMPVAPPPPVFLKALPPAKAPTPPPPPPPPKAPAPPESQQAPPKAPAPPESQQAPPKAPAPFERQQAPSKAPAPPPPPPPPKAAALLSPPKAPALFGSQQAPAKAPSPPIAPPSPPAQGKRRASAVPAPTPAKKLKGPKKTHRCVDRLKAVKQAIEKGIESIQLGKALEWQLVMEEGGDRAIGCLLKTSTGWVGELVNFQGTVVKEKATKNREEKQAKQKE